MEKLSQADVRKLLEDPSAEARTQAASKIAANYEDGDTFSDQERKIAEEIFGLMCKDAEVQVREALSQNLKDCAFLPRDIARSLADDVDAVSIPVLRSSTVLTDEDLIEIVRSHGEDKQKAIAARASVSESVSDALIDTRNEAVVGTLVANNGATISEPSMQRVLDDFADSDLVKTSMVNRNVLPVQVAERLVNMVSEKLQQQILARHELPAEQVADLIAQSREKATLGLLDGRNRQAEARQLIAHLYQQGRLTPTIILRALCMGDMDFFEGSIAVLSRVPISRTRDMIHAGDREKVRSILNRAKLPEALVPAFTAAIEVADETDYDGGEHDQERFQRRLIERIVTNFDDPDSAMGDDNVEYLMAKLAQINVGVSAQR